MNCLRTEAIAAYVQVPTKPARMQNWEEKSRIQVSNGNGMARGRKEKEKGEEENLHRLYWTKTIDKEVVYW